MFLQILSEIKAIQAAVAAHDLKTAAGAFIVVQQQVYDLLFGPQLMGATPEAHAELDAAVQECVAQCRAVGAGEVGKLGDGKFLQLVIQFLPLILSLFGK